MVWAISKYIKTNYKDRYKNMKKFSTSKYLITRAINDNYIFVYNSLYINSRILRTEDFDKLQGIKNLTEQECVERLDKNSFMEFIKLKYIVDANTNERETVQEELKHREQKLSSGCFFQRMHLSTTNSCNMNCEYCFCKNFEYKYSGDTNAGVRFPIENMSFDVAEQAMLEAIKVIKSNKNNQLSIEFFGGEPLLNYKMIIEVLNKFKNGEDYGINISYGVTTNGTYIADEIIELFHKYNVSVAISIDYIDYENGTFRGEGASLYNWTVIDKNIKKLIDNDIRVKFQSVLSEQTWDKNIFNLIDYAAENKIFSFGLILSFDFSFYSNYTPEKIIEKVKKIYFYCKEKNVLLTGYWKLSFEGLINPDEWNDRRDWKTCPTIGRLLSIEPNGDVYACKTTARKMGNINRFEEIFQDDNYRYYATRAYSNSKDCEGCEIEGVCSGNCAGAVENQYKDIRKMDTHYCRTVRGIIHFLLEDYLKTVNIEELEE